MENMVTISRKDWKRIVLHFVFGPDGQAQWNAAGGHNSQNPQCCYNCLVGGKMVTFPALAAGDRCLCLRAFTQTSGRVIAQPTVIFGDNNF